MPSKVTAIERIDPASLDVAFNHAMGILLENATAAQQQTTLIGQAALTASISSLDGSAAIETGGDDA